MTKKNSMTHLHWCNKCRLLKENKSEKAVKCERCGDETMNIGYVEHVSEESSEKVSE